MRSQPLLAYHSGDSLLLVSILFVAIALVGCTEPNRSADSSERQSGASSTTTRSTAVETDSFEAFRQDFRKGKLPYIATNGYDDPSSPPSPPPERSRGATIANRSDLSIDFVKGESIDSVHVARFLRETGLWEKFGTSLTSEAMSPYYGHQLQLSGKYVALTYVFRSAPEPRMYLTTFTLEGDLIDELVINSRMSSHDTSVWRAGLIKSADSIAVFKATYQAADSTWTVDTTHHRVTAAGQIEQISEDR